MIASRTRLCEALGLDVPLIVAPMAGGPTTTSLVVASSEAGALGSLGGAYFSPELITENAARIRQRTARPFAINLFIPTPWRKVADEDLRRAIDATQKFRDELKIPSPAVAPPYEEDFARQCEAVLRFKPKVLSFVFGLLPDEVVKEARRQEILTIGTATSLEEALQLEESGIDAITLQGFEAGGHRGIFDAAAKDPEVRVAELLREAKARIRIPLIAAGGIMVSTDIQAALYAGAEAVQMGTAFLTTTEAGTSAPYRQRLLETSDRETRTTRAFSGRLARGMVNHFMRELDPRPEAILPFPLQNKFTRDLRNAATTAGSSEYLSLWSGMGRGELWTGSAAELIARLFR